MTRGGLTAEEEELRTVGARDGHRGAEGGGGGGRAPRDRNGREGEGGRAEAGELGGGKRRGADDSAAAAVDLAPHGREARASTTM